MFFLKFPVTDFLYNLCKAIQDPPMLTNTGYRMHDSELRLHWNCAFDKRLFFYTWDTQIHFRNYNTLVFPHIFFILICKYIYTYIYICIPVAQGRSLWCTASVDLAAAFCKFGLARFVCQRAPGGMIVEVRTLLRLLGVIHADDPLVIWWLPENSLKLSCGSAGWLNYFC